MTHSAPALPRPALGRPPHPRVPRAERWTLSNGLRVAAVLDRRVPHLALRLIVGAGSTADPSGRPGTASLTGSLLLEGTAEHDALQLHQLLDAQGAALDVHVGHDFAAVHALLLTDTVEAGLRLLAQVATRPVFPERELERLRAETLDAIAARDDEPGNVADDRLAVALFGTAHPYGVPVWGSAEAVRDISRRELAAFHSARYRPEGSVLVAAGDPGGVDLPRMLETLFGDWRGRAPDAPIPPQLAPGERAAFVDRPDAAQAELRVGTRGLARTAPEWTVAAVANYVLGGSPITSRLGVNLREGRGWTYGVRSSLVGGVAAGGWSIETAVEAEVAAGAVSEIRRELLRLREELVPEDELGRAKDALILSLPRAWETPSCVAGRLATQEAFQLPPDYWERWAAEVATVTPAEVRRLMQEHFGPGEVIEVVVGPRVNSG